MGELTEHLLYAEDEAESHHIILRATKRPDASDLGLHLRRGCGSSALVVGFGNAFVARMH